jgi:outer membrane protein assembly factor BamB
MRRSLRHTGTLYFFPALLPLAELVPWLLTVIGTVAGIAGFSAPALWRRYRRPILAVAALSLTAAAGAYIYYLPPKDVRMDGTRLIMPEKFFISVAHAKAAELQPPARETFGEIWSKKIDRQILATPVIAGNLLVYGSYKDSVEARSLQNGDAVWSLPQAAPVFALGLGDDGTIYSCEGLHDTASASLTAVDPATGRIRWRREFLGHLEEPPAIDSAHHRLWQGAGPGGLWALDDRKGAVLWHQAIGHTDALPLLLNDVIYVPAQPDEKKEETAFLALDAGTGKILWQLKMPGMPWGGPVTDRTKKIILTTTGLGQIGVSRATDKGWAQAVTPDGKLLWQAELASMPLQPGAYVAEAGLIVYALKNGDIVALRVADGTQVWKGKAGDELQSTVTLFSAGGRPMIAATSYDGVFTIHDAVTGEQLVRRLAGKSATSSPVVGGDIIYVTGAYEIVAFGGLHALAGKK